LSDGTGGTAGDGRSSDAGPNGLSCGQVNNLHGYLTYDTAAYWTPTAYLADQNQTPITPARLRVYYFGAHVQVSDFLAGAQLIGGLPSAANPAGNQHLEWGCGNQGRINTPVIDHPYDCGPWKLMQ